MRGMARDPSNAKAKVGAAITKEGKERMKSFHRGGWKDEGDWWKLPEDVEGGMWVEWSGWESSGKDDGLGKPKSID